MGYQVNVEVSACDVIDSFAPYQEGDFNISDDEVVRISLFVYDESGSLVDNNTVECHDYLTKANFSFKLVAGKYTLVASSDIYMSSDDFETWSYYNVENINEFRIKQNYRNGIEGILGLGITDIKVDEPQNVKIMLTAATALVRWNMSHIHNVNEPYVDSLELERYCISIDTMSVFNESVNIGYHDFTYLSISDSNYYHLACMNPSACLDSSESVYDYFSILPVRNTSILITADVTNICNDSSYLMVYSTIDPIIATFKSGEQYLMDIDFEMGKMELKPYDGDSVVCVGNNANLYKRKDDAFKLIEFMECYPY